MVPESESEVVTEDLIRIRISKENYNLVRTRTLQHTIFESTTFEELVKTIDDPDLVFPIISAYRAYRQLMDMGNSEIQREDGVRVEDMLIHRAIVKDFLKTSEEAVHRISELELN